MRRIASVISSGVRTYFGYTLFTWLLKEVPLHVANTSAYAGPVVGLARAGCC